jgi:hypothetical protein
VKFLTISLLFFYILNAQNQYIPDANQYWYEQWNLHHTSQYPGTVDADIDAPEAWFITTSGSTVQGDEIVMV